MALILIVDLNQHQPEQHPENQWAVYEQDESTGNRMIRGYEISHSEVRRPITNNLSPSDKHHALEAYFKEIRKKMTLERHMMLLPSVLHHFRIDTQAYKGFDNNAVDLVLEMAKKLFPAFQTHKPKGRPKKDGKQDLKLLAAIGNRRRYDNLSVNEAIKKLIQEGYFGDKPRRSNVSGNEAAKRIRAHDHAVIRFANKHDIKDKTEVTDLFKSLYSITYIQLVASITTP